MEGPTGGLEMSLQPQGSRVSSPFGQFRDLLSDESVLGGEESDLGGGQEFSDFPSPLRPTFYLLEICFTGLRRPFRKRSCRAVYGGFLKNRIDQDPDQGLPLLMEIPPLDAQEEEKDSEKKTNREWPSVSDPQTIWHFSKGDCAKGMRGRNHP